MEKLNCFYAWLFRLPSGRPPKISLTAYLMDLYFPFKDLSYAFFNYFVASKKRKENSSCLLSITQKNRENLIDFIKYFNTERLDIRDCSDVVDVAAFTNGSKGRDLLKSLYLNPLENFVTLWIRQRTT